MVSFLKRSRSGSVVLAGVAALAGAPGMARATERLYRDPDGNLNAVSSLYGAFTATFVAGR